MPAVRGHPGAEARAVGDGDARVVAVGHVEPPGIVEVVLGARALDRRHLLPVDVEHVVAFAVPARLRLQDVLDGSGVEPAAPRLEEDERLPVGGRRQELPVPRVEVRRVGRERRHLLPVHVVVEPREAVALVRHGDAAGLPERHRPVAVARPAVGAVADHERLHAPLEPVAHGEEVAERRVDRRDVASVVIRADAQKARPAVLRSRGRRPDVRHDPRPLEVGDRERLARVEMRAVVVPVGVPRVGRRTVGLEVFELGERRRVDRAGDGRLGEHRRRRRHESRKDTERERPPHDCPPLENWRGV